MGLGRTVLEISLETIDDWWEVEALFDLCFAPGREALSTYRMRDDVPPISDLCFVIRDDFGVLEGAVRFWEVYVGQYKALLLGPIAVHPTRQGEGLGGYLIKESLSSAQTLGWKRVLLIGDYKYYGRFGFRKLENVEMPPPINPKRVLGLALFDGAWDSVYGKVSKKIF